MKVLSITTYFLPILGIEVKDVSVNALLQLNTKGYELAVSQISLFELSAKGSKYVVKNQLSPERIALGIRAILNDDIVAKIPVYEDKVIIYALNFRALMNDFVDCLILATALTCCDSLITEDQVIHSLKKNARYLGLVDKANPNFTIQNWAEISKKHSS